MKLSMRSGFLAPVLLLGLAACDDSRRTQDTEATHGDKVMQEMQEPQRRPNANAPAIGGEKPPMGPNPDNVVYGDAGVGPNQPVSGTTTGGTGASRSRTPRPVGANEPTTLAPPGATAPAPSGR